MTDSRPPAPRGVAWGDLPFVCLAALCAGAVLYLGRSLTFWNDEWRAITFDGAWSDYLRPVNEHWTTLPLLAYRATFRLAGLESYLPYLAQVVVLHAVAAGGVYVVARRRLGRLLATLLAIPLLLLGSGAENLFWAFQTSFVGSVAFGVWAIVVVEQRGRWAALASSGLLLASLMCSGIGLVFVVAASVRTLLDPTCRRRALAVVPPLAVYVAWYAWAGHAPVEARHVAPAVEIGRFVWRGVSHSTAAVTGLNRLPGGATVAGVAVLAALVALGWLALTRRPRPLATAALVALVALYVLAGSVRAHLDFDYATVSRYVYVAGFLLALALADALEPLRERTAAGLGRRLPWVVVVGVGCALVTLANLGPLRAGRDGLLDQADRSRAFITFAKEYHGEPWVDPRSGYGVMPPVPSLVALLEAHGTPAPDTFFPGAARMPPPAASEAALLVLVGDRFGVERVSASGSAPAAVELGEVVDADVVERDGCFLIRAAGPSASATFEGPDGVRYRLSAPRDERIVAVLGLALPPTAPLVVDVPARMPVDVVVPDIRPATSARVRIEAARSSSPVTVCPVRPRGDA